MELKKQPVSLIITDLDDTIWDWQTMWHASFLPLITRISKEFNIDQSTLESSFKSIHQEYHTSEASFAINKLDCLSKEQKKACQQETNGQISILHEYYSNKKYNLKLYPGVIETLLLAKSAGTKIIGFTESNSFFTQYRIKHLELDGIFEFIYAPKDSGIPKKVKRFYSKDYWKLKKTKIVFLDKYMKKPNVDILNRIIKDSSADRAKTIYIGDKIHKDIYMAQNAGITSVHASYGENIDNDAYNLLRKVTHWTDEEVQREIDFKKKHEHDIVVPSYKLEERFDELTKFFEFVAFPSPISEKDKEHIITIWNQIIQVQMHFNDIELKIRNYVITTLTFIIAAIGFLLKEKVFISVFGSNIPAASVIGFLGLVVIWAFYFMDRIWYHRLLHGSVKQAMLIEKRWKHVLPEIFLSNSIKEASHYKFLWCITLNSDWKIRIFYLVIAAVLVLISTTLLFYNPEIITIK